MLRIEDAIELAARSHRGQKDKNKQPYIEHPIRVMMAVSTETEKIVAVLHDVIEDCPSVTTADLRRWGYSKEIVDAIETLTKRPEEEKDYDAFILRVLRGSTLAIRVKLADVNDNLSPARRPAHGDLARHEKRLDKYRRAQALLREELVLRCEAEMDVSREPSLLV